MSKALVFAPILSPKIVKSRMRAFRKNHKIFLAVIEALSVDMMYHFVPPKLAPEFTLHHSAVFAYLLPADLKDSVSVGIDPASARGIPPQNVRTAVASPSAVMLLAKTTARMRSPASLHFAESRRSRRREFESVMGHPATIVKGTHFAAVGNVAASWDPAFLFAHSEPESTQPSLPEKHGVVLRAITTRSGNRPTTLSFAENCSHRKLGYHN